MSFQPPPSPSPPGPLRTEQKTVSAMVHVYCAEHHHEEALCPSCRTLLAYSHARLEACPFGVDKPTCRECPIHCYRPAERAAMRDVMQFAGPRMLFRHPWLAIVHLWKKQFHKAARRRGHRRRTDVP